MRNLTWSVVLVGAVVGSSIAGYKVSEKHSLKNEWNLGLLRAVGGGLSKLNALEMMKAGDYDGAVDYLEGLVEVDEAGAKALTSDPHLALDENLRSYRGFRVKLEKYRDD